MNTLFNNFVKEITGYTEEEFYKIIDSLPNCIEDCLDNIDFSEYYPNDETLERYIINKLLEDLTESAYIDYLNENEKTVVISDIESLEELQNVVDALKPWTIKNYKEIKEDVEEYEKESKIELMKCNIVNSIWKTSSEETLNKIQSILNNDLK